jgi:hypothetical protein
MERRRLCGDCRRLSVWTCRETISHSLRTTLCQTCKRSTSVNGPPYTESNPIVSFSGNSMDALTNIDADFFKIVRFNDNFLPKIADLRFEPQSEFCGNTMATLSQLTINTALLSANSLPSLTTVDIYIVGEFGSNALTVSRQFRIKNVKVFKNNTINAEWVPIELQSAGIEIFEDNTFTDVMTLLLMNNSIKAFDRNTVSCKKQTEYNFLQGNPL